MDLERQKLQSLDCDTRLKFQRLHPCMAVLQILVCLYIGTCAIDFEAKLHDNEFYNVKTQQTGLYQAVDTVFR